MRLLQNADVNQLIMTCTVHIPIFVAALNLALNKPAKQSSLLFAAEKAVDGNYDSFSHTADGDTSTKWWQVNLEKKYVIGEIKLYNRPGFCKYHCTKFASIEGVGIERD